MLGKILFINRTAEEILGLSASELVGRDCREALKMPELVERLFSALYFLKPENRSEVSVVSRMGRLIPLGMSTALLGEKETGIRGVVAVFQDLTYAKLMEEKVKARERLAAVGELSAGIAHEIRAAHQRPVDAGRGKFQPVFAVDRVLDVEDRRQRAR